MIDWFFDHETHKIRRALLAPPIVCTSYAVDDHPDVAVELWKDSRDRCREAVRGGHLLIGANTAYDATVEMAADPEFISLWVLAFMDGRVRDVQYDAKLLAIANGENTERSWSLAQLANEVGIELEKEDWRRHYAELDGVPVSSWPRGAIDYSRWDAVATRAVHRFNQLREQPWVDAGFVVTGRHAALNAAAAWALHLASCWGVCTDPKRTAELADRVNAHLDEIRGELVEAGLVRRAGNPADVRAWNKRMKQLEAQERSKYPGVDPKQLKAYLKAVSEINNDGCPDGKRCDVAAAARMVKVMTETGRRRQITLTETGEEQLALREAQGEDPALVHEEFVRELDYIKLDRDCAILSGDELLVQRADYVTSNLLLNRVERMKQGHVLPLQTRFDACKDTFRTSSTQPDNEDLVGEQMQNFPQGKKEEAYGLRETFCPRNVVRGPWGEDEGIFIGADYSMFELHSLSQVCFKLFGYTNMGVLLNQRIDVHWHFAAKSLGLTIEQTKALSDASRQRSRAKPLNFGIPGGMGPDKIILYSRKGYGIRFERDEVVHLRKIWLYETFPEVPEMFAWTNQQLQGRRSFTHMHPVTEYIRGGCGYTDGNNENFQHLAAYAAKVAVVEVTAACFNPESPLFGWRLWNFVHDELLLEGPRSGASAAAKELARIMVECANRFMPDFPTRAEPFVTKIWSKKCESVVDVHGNILEWSMAS